MKINIRKAKINDIYNVFELSNLNSTRKYSINKILWKYHLNWYEEVLEDDRIVIYFVTSDNEFLGKVR